MFCDFLLTSIYFRWILNDFESISIHFKKEIVHSAIIRGNQWESLKSVSEPIRKARRLKKKIPWSRPTTTPRPSHDLATTGRDQGTFLIGLLSRDKEIKRNTKKYQEILRNTKKL